MNILDFCSRHEIPPVQSGVLSADDLKGTRSPVFVSAVHCRLRSGMKVVFDTYDTKGQGVIKTSLLGKILRQLGLNPLESDIQRVSKEVDPQSNLVRSSYSFDAVHRR